MEWHHGPWRRTHYFTDPMRALAQPGHCFVLVNLRRGEKWPMTLDGLDARRDRTANHRRPAPP
jgi:hypothetical protein